jgi:hypothetical protein
MPRIPRDGVPKPKPKPKGEGERQLVSFPLIVAPPKGVSSARGAEESLRDGPLGAQFITESSGRPGSGVPLAEEAPGAQPSPRAQRPS